MHYPYPCSGTRLQEEREQKRIAEQQQKRLAREQRRRHEEEQRHKDTHPKQVAPGGSRVGAGLQCRRRRKGSDGESQGWGG